MFTPSHRIIQARQYQYVYALNRNKRAKLYLPSTFQTSDAELLSQKIETEYTS